MTINEIQARLRKITGHLYPHYRRYYQRCAWDELMECGARCEEDLPFWGKTWTTDYDWECEPWEHLYDSYTRIRAHRDAVRSRIPEREWAHDITDYDS
jgi:hypothetical protein